MKRVLLTLSVILASAAAFSQVVVSGISPASIQGNYDYGVQANCGAWPGEIDDSTWNVLSNLDFNVPGTFVQAEAVLVDDGSVGTNPQYGNNLSEEGCNPLINNTDMNPLNDLTGKIAVIRRNTCSFGTKVQMAQDAGAIAAIIVNREDALVSMLGDANFPNVSIPAVFLSIIDGDLLIQSIENGEQPVMFIGNKLGAFTADAGAVKGEFMVSPFGGANSVIYNGFTPGIQVYNYGQNPDNITVTATIDGPGTSADYTSTVGPIAMNPGDTLSIFEGNPESFSAWNLGIGNYPDGDYTLTYNVTLGSGADDFPFDNIYSADFKVQSDVISLSRLDAANMPISNSFPSNSTTEYNSCMMFQNPNASSLAVAGMYFVPHTDTSVNELAGAEIFLRAYQWDDAWTDLNDPNFTFDPTTNDGFLNLNLITFADYYPASDDEVDDVAYQNFQTPFVMQDNVRYLFCLQTFESATISFGYDNAIDYGANYSILAQPISPVIVDGDSYAAGWSGVSATSIALRTFDPASLGLDEVNAFGAKAFPNPANNDVTIVVTENGQGSIVVTDIAGKVVLSTSANFANGQANLSLAGFESGVYIFNVTMENGAKAQFNVVKN